MYYVYIEILDFLRSLNWDSCACYSFCPISDKGNSKHCRPRGRVCTVWLTHCHCILVDSSIVIHVSWTFVILGVSGLFCRFYSRWKILLANRVDPDQTPHYVASDLGLHCLCMTLFTGFQVRMGFKSLSVSIKGHWGYQIVSFWL